MDLGGKSAPPHDIAIALNQAPTSGTWRSLCGASLAYGLTDGGYNAKEIVLTPLGRQIMGSENESERAEGRLNAVLKPRVMRAFMEKYDRAKFPSELVAEHVLKGLGLPAHRLAGAVEILRANGKYAGILKTMKTGLFVSIDSPSTPAASSPNQAESEGDTVDASVQVDEQKGDFSKNVFSPLLFAPNCGTNRVFVGHGKNKGFVSQIKELLLFGRFEPVVSVENETTSIPVPDKVFEDMRSCSAGIIHISEEDKLLDQNGQEESASTRTF